MTGVEDRLHDAFAAVDRQIVAEPRQDPVRRSPVLPRVLLAAAAIAVVAAAFSVLALVTNDDAVELDAAAISPSAFDSLVEPLCVTARQERGSDPRFATVEAYRIVAEQRQVMIFHFRERLAAIAPPRDDLLLPALVLDRLASAMERVDHVLDLVDLGRADALPGAWPAVDQYIESAGRALADHGAEECRP